MSNWLMLSTRGLTFATVAVVMHGRAVIRVPAQREIYNFPSLPHGIDLMQPGRVAHDVVRVRRTRPALPTWNFCGQ